MMGERWHGWLFGGVVIAHVFALFCLSRAMAPSPQVQPESVLLVEWFDSMPEPELEPQLELEPKRPEMAPSPEPDASPPVEEAATPSPALPRRRPSVTTEAVIEPAPSPASPPDAPREFVSPEKDPFSRPTDPDANRFGRRGIASLPTPNRPRLPGEASPDAPLQGLRHRDVGAKEVVDMVAAFLGGGSNAPVEAPCGGRVNGGFGTADSFSPHWQQQYGCGDAKERAGFDGHFEQPPGTIR